MNEKVKENLDSTFRALKHKNYRLFFFGQGISLIGTWIQQIAISWLIYSLTKSPLIMGVITFLGTIPSLFISPFAGVIIDRVNKYHSLIIIQTLFMIEAFLLAMLTLSGSIQVWQIVILSVLVGITMAIDMPLRQSFVIQLIGGSEDLGNAISLNSLSFNLARLIGPAIAGILIARVGEGICFLINSISYLAVIGVLIAIKINVPKQPQMKKINVLSELKEGIIYSFNTPPIKKALIFLATSSFIGMSFPVLMPIFAKEILNGNAQTLGFLMSASGIGALIGALYLAGQKTVDGLEKIIAIAAVICGTGLLGLAFCNKISISLVLLFAIGLGMVVIMASCNTLIQYWVDDNKRGRVMSLYTMAFMGTAPLGSLCGGAIADKIGVANTFLIGGIGMIMMTLVYNLTLKKLPSSVN